MHIPDQANPSSNFAGGSSLPTTKLGFMELPLETQKEIVKHVLSKKDLLNLQCASRHFHRLASAKLYSELQFTLTHADAHSYYSLSCTRLADALHTFATSEHDYGQYVRCFTLMLSERDTEDVQRRVLSKYHWEEESNRLLNTTLLLMLRKARALETFCWDTAIELSRHVYQTLSQIGTLHTLCIRLDTSMIPRVASFTQQQQLSQGHGPIVVPVPTTAYGQPPQANSYGQVNPKTATPGLTQHNQNTATSVIAMHKKGNPYLSGNAKPKFVGFKDLRHLNILGIDNLDCLPDISSCVLACSATLKSLKLSLSFELARRARKPSAPSAPVAALQDPLDDEDSEDMTPPPEPVMTSGIAPPNEADIKKEKTAQESILAKIFGLDTKVEDKRVERTLKATAASFKSKENMDEIFLENMKGIMAKVLQAKATLGYKVLASDKTLLKEMEKAVKKYLKSDVAKSKALKPAVLPESKPFLFSDLQPSGVPLHSYKFGANDLDSAYQTFQDLWGEEGEPPTLGEFESFLQVNGGQNPAGAHQMGHYQYDYPSSLSGHGPPVGQFKSSASQYPFHNLGPSSPGHNHNHPGIMSQLFQEWNKKKMPIQSYVQLKKDMLDGKISHEMYYALKSDKALQDTYMLDQAVQDKYTMTKAMQMQDDEHKAMHDMLGLSGASGLPFPQSGDQADATTETDGSVVDGETIANGNVADEGTSVTNQPYFPAVLLDPKDQEDGMDIDMEHPDVVESDEDATPAMNVDADPQAVQEANLLLGIATRQEIASASGTTPDTTNGAPPVKLDAKSFRTPVRKQQKPKIKSTDETMQEYIRTQHGFNLEDLTLYLIPLKPSVIGKALDMSCLQKLTLLSVGPQGGFWSYVAKVQKESFSSIHLHYIHTDDVSMAFLNCIAHLSGLRDLLMMRRSSKDSDPSSLSPPASISDIRLLALRKHVSTLERLMVMNNEDDSWDLDSKSMRLLTAKGVLLKELSFSVNVTDYHVLMQGLPGLKKLVAMYILAIRTTDPCASITRECRRFTIDNIFHCPQLKIRYLAMTGLVFELGRRPGSVVKKKVVVIDVKGKGKAKASDPIPVAETSTDSEDFSEIEGGGLEMACVKHLKFPDVPDIVIFQKEIRTGKL
ncbi:hypothetical protein MMC11_001203 [Xylographa trunciseda]|nr:hypothetical protein [Xylographa trunciseda]